MSFRRIRLSFCVKTLSQRRAILGFKCKLFLKSNRGSTTRLPKSNDPTFKSNSLHYCSFGCCGNDPSTFHVRELLPKCLAFLTFSGCHIIPRQEQDQNCANS
ncbi:hypothetical protein AVEN_28580-1 [Araneus ventricosus]|uniref:Uncharacterized protein n=1 Tax=Araneus ventricosus TaxID=182803 RepID=A0A4Y2DDM9_ARAVE|nr:hypothetical protein AVEN_28580-1 [Araneus ventricosus]